MHLTLTDHLTCPRCGPSAGLILLMERAVERRVEAGALGCPVCRTQYPIRDRVADLRPDAEGREVAADSPATDAGGDVDAGALALRVAALMELSDGGGFVLLDGPRSLEVARALRRIAPEVEAVVAIRAAEAAAAARVEASALLDSGRLPVADRVLRGAAYVGGAPGADRLEELMRVTRPTGRVVVDLAGRPGDLEGTAAALEAKGASVRARDAAGLVAVLF